MKKKNYSVSLTLGDKVIKGSGATAFDALGKLRKPEKIVTKGFLKITEGKRKAEVMLMPSKAKYLFYPLSRLIWAKRIELLLK